MYLGAVIHLSTSIPSEPEMSGRLLLCALTAIAAVPAAAAQGKPEVIERLIVDHCYFRGMEDSDTIKSTLLADNARNAEIGISVTLKNICEKPLGLGGREQ